MATNGSHHDDAFPADDRATIVALADGSLAPDLVTDARRRVEGDSDLRTALEAQGRAVTLVHAGRLPAPDGLRARIQQDREQAPSQGRPRQELSLLAAEARQHLRIVGAAAAALLIVLALVIAGSGGGGSAPGPSLSALARVGTQAPTKPAPRAARRRKLLSLGIEGVAFPDLRHFGWTATGSRTDRVSGHSARTVFYVKRGATVAYTILAGPAVAASSGGKTVIRGPVQVHEQTVNGRQVASLIRAGHTVVLSGSVPAATLAGLGSWTGNGTIPF